MEVTLLGCTKTVRWTIVGASMALALAIAAPVQASTADASARASEQGNVAVESAQAGWEFFDDYWTYDGCQAEGFRGLQRGEWTDFQCRPSGVDWNLWVLRP